MLIIDAENVLIRIDKDIDYATTLGGPTNVIV